MGSNIRHCPPYKREPPFDIQMSDPASTMVIGVIVISLTAGIAIMSLAGELETRADAIANDTAQWGGRVGEAIHGLFSEGKTLYGDYPDLVGREVDLNGTMVFYQDSIEELEALNETEPMNESYT
jgi:hypothetical protein